MPHSVLVVDDDPSIRDAVGRALRLDGYSVTLAGDGLGALREIEAAAQDVVLLDLGLPELDDLGEATNSLDVYVGYLRRKLEAGGEPRLIHTVRGFGYVLKT